jgi:very-short-patch-repair endonuclease
MPRRPSFNKTKQRAKVLRREMTAAERALWERLRNRQLGGFKFH